MKKIPAKFISEPDGKEFDNDYDCLEHERSIEVERLYGLDEKLFLLTGKRYYGNIINRQMTVFISEYPYTINDLKSAFEENKEHIDEVIDKLNLFETYEGDMSKTTSVRYSHRNSELNYNYYYIITRIK